MEATPYNDGARKVFIKIFQGSSVDAPLDSVSDSTFC